MVQMNVNSWAYISNNYLVTSSSSICFTVDWNLRYSLPPGVGLGLGSHQLPVEVPLACYENWYHNSSPLFLVWFFFFKSHALLENTNCLCYISYLTDSCAKYHSMNNQGSLWNPVYNRKKVTDPTLKKSSSWNKNLVVQEERMTRGCSLIRTHRWGRTGSEGPSVFGSAFLFILYSICITLQFGAYVGPREA